MLPAAVALVKLFSGQSLESVFEQLELDLRQSGFDADKVDFAKASAKWSYDAVRQS